MSTSKAAQSATWRKECRRCGKKKIASSFAINNNNPDKLQSVCKPCQSEMAKERKARLDEFLKDKPSGEMMSLSAYSHLSLISPAKLKKMCESGEVPAVNLGTMKNSAWRIFVPEPDPHFVEDPTEVAAGNTPAGGPSLDLPVETLARLGGKIARLEGMADMLGPLVDGTENFVLELHSFFDEVKGLISNA